MSQPLAFLLCSQCRWHNIAFETTDAAKLSFELSSHPDCEPWLDCIVLPDRLHPNEIHIARAIASTKLRSHRFELHNCHKLRLSPSLITYLPAQAPDLQGELPPGRCVVFRCAYRASVSMYRLQQLLWRRLPRRYQAWKAQKLGGPG